MNPDQAAKWAEEYHDEIAGLDERTKEMLEKKLGKASDTKNDALRPESIPSNPQIKPPIKQVEKKPEGPKLQRFICNRFPDRWILVGTKEIKFSRGEFKTSDPELIDAICNEPDFGLWILADAPELRKKYKRRR